MCNDNGVFWTKVAEAYPRTVCDAIARRLSHRLNENGIALAAIDSHNHGHMGIVSSTRTSNKVISTHVEERSHASTVNSVRVATSPLTTHDVQSHAGADEDKISFPTRRTCAASVMMSSLLSCEIDSVQFAKRINHNHDAVGGLGAGVRDTTDQIDLPDSIEDRDERELETEPLPSLPPPDCSPLEIDFLRVWIEREELLYDLLTRERLCSICDVKLRLINLTLSETDPPSSLLFVYLGGTTLFFHLTMEFRGASARPTPSARTYTVASRSPPKLPRIDQPRDVVMANPDGDE